jgi:hypothetical protein
MLVLFLIASSTERYYVLVHTADLSSVCASHVMRLRRVLA